MYDRLGEVLELPRDGCCETAGIRPGPHAPPRVHRRCLTLRVHPSCTANGWQARRGQPSSPATLLPPTLSPTPSFGPHRTHLHVRRLGALKVAGESSGIQGGTHHHQAEVVAPLAAHILQAEGRGHDVAARAMHLYVKNAAGEATCHGRTRRQPSSGAACSKQCGQRPRHKCAHTLSSPNSTSVATVRSCASSSTTTCGPETNGTSWRGVRLQLPATRGPARAERSCACAVHFFPNKWQRFPLFSHKLPSRAAWTPWLHSSTPSAASEVAHNQLGAEPALPSAMGRTASPHLVARQGGVNERLSQQHAIGEVLDARVGAGAVVKAD